MTPVACGRYVAARPSAERTGARVVEEARLESVLTSKALRGFESHLLRRMTKQAIKKGTIIIVPFNFFKKVYFNRIIFLVSVKCDAEIL